MFIAARERERRYWKTHHNYSMRSKRWYEVTEIVHIQFTNIVLRVRKCVRRKEIFVLPIASL